MSPSKVSMSVTSLPRLLLRHDRESGEEVRQSDIADTHDWKVKFLVKTWGIVSVCGLLNEKVWLRLSVN
jgi:hypothetical protein